MTHLQHNEPNASNRTLIDSLQQMAFNARLRTADLALQTPVLKTVFLDRLLKRLNRTHREFEQDPDKLRHDLWFGQRLEPFLRRLIAERPAAARAILRFLGTWIRDIQRRRVGRDAGHVTPCTVVIEPTDRCNLNCPGCYANSTREGSDLPYERLEEIVREVTDMGVTLVTLSGGEPFLRERDDAAITRLASQFDHVGFLVYTNGMLIDEAVAERLGRVGNVFPAISVEGAEHQTDARRGKGVYRHDRTVREMLAAHGVMAGFSATVTRENCESICQDAFIERRIDEGDLFGWFFLMMPIGRSPRSDLMVTADQRALLRETVYRWRDEERPIFLGDFWNDGHLVGGCIAGGRFYFHIYANGDISPCVFSPVACGNVFDIVEGRSDYESLGDFVQRHPVFRAYREEQDGIADRARPCLLIDHPEAFRRIATAPGCRAAKNMPAGYLDGDIARRIDTVARDWEATAATLPPLPAERVADTVRR